MIHIIYVYFCHMVDFVHTGGLHSFWLNYASHRGRSQIEWVAQYDTIFRAQSLRKQQHNIHTIIVNINI